MKPRIYLAGPDLFYVDASQRYVELKALCSTHGLEGVAPTDGQTILMEPTPVGARRIYRHDLATMLSCQAVLANLTPFRGPEPDSGTAFEVGYAVALGMQVCGYVGDSLDLLTRLRTTMPCYADEGGEYRDKANAALIEDFGLPLNLMLACGALVSEKPSQAIAVLARGLLRDC